jgi:hypothetical protein
MKIILTTIALGGMAFAACAQDDWTNTPPQQGRPGSGPGRHHPPIPAIVLALDTNHDGVIDASEIANASAELLTLDKKGDGRLTWDEYMGKRPGSPPDSNNGDAGTPPDGAPAMAPDDGTNAPPQGGPGFGPGRHHPPIPAIVLALDVNHDGVIDASEIANAPAELKTLDKNGDGRLTRDEYMGKRPGPPPQDGNGGNEGGGLPDDAPPVQP